MEEFIVGIVLGALICVPIAALLIVFKRLLYICQPNEVLVFEGRRRTLPDGSRLDYTVIENGRGMRIPVLEQVKRLDLSTMTVDIQVSNAYSRGNIPLNVHAIANVKICGRPGIIDNALERFLGRSREEIREVAKETIEGALRGVLATLTPEQVNEERTTFVHALARDVEDDLNQLGLTIDTLNIQSVTDDVKYLDNIGRAQIAAVLRDAEVAESDNKREAEQSIADADARGRVADEQARANIQRSENDLRRVKADLEVRARSAEERTEQARFEARSRAEVQLQEVRARLERLRLQADEVLPAEAEREASRLLAEGQSAAITAKGDASAEALRLVSEIWTQAGANAEDIFVLQEIEALLEEVAGRLKNVKISRVNLIDGGDGASLGKLAAAYPAMIGTVFATLEETTGINIKDILRRESKGRVRMPRRVAERPASDAQAPMESVFRSPRYGERLAEEELGEKTQSRASVRHSLAEEEAADSSARLDEELQAIRERVDNAQRETDDRRRQASEQAPNSPSTPEKSASRVTQRIVLDEPVPGANQQRGPRRSPSDSDQGEDQ